MLVSHRREAEEPADEGPQGVDGAVAASVEVVEDAGTVRALPGGLQEALLPAHPQRPARGGEDGQDGVLRVVLGAARAAPWRAVHAGVAAEGEGVHLRFAEQTENVLTEPIDARRHAGDRLRGVALRRWRRAQCRLATAPRQGQRKS